VTIFTLPPDVAASSIQSASVGPRDPLARVTGDCQCEECVECCHRPGWFAPGEVEKAAKLFDIPLDKFKQRYIRKVADTDEPYKKILMPRMHGKWCTFFDPETRSCGVHAAKPMECREALACDNSAHRYVKEDVADLWRGYCVIPKGHFEPPKPIDAVEIALMFGKYKKASIRVAR
jgi:Fe-S-cluster containining protein